MDLSFKKMPIDFFEYYSLSEPYISSYHKIGKINKAQNLYKKIEEKYLDQIKYYSISMKEYGEIFDIGEFAENIFTYTERYRGLIEDQINLGNYTFVIPSIEYFINYTEIFKDIYGEYDYYMFLISFLEPLYVSNENNSARKLYENISNQIVTRIETIISAKDESSFSYLSDLFDEEIESAKRLIDIISVYEEKEYIDFESTKYKDFINEFLIK